MNHYSLQSYCVDSLTKLPDPAQAMVTHAVNLLFTAAGTTDEKWKSEDGIYYTFDFDFSPACDPDIKRKCRLTMITK